MNPSDKPIYADEIGVSIRLKAVKNEKTGTVEKDGMIGIMFIDATKRQVVGEFVVSKITAKGFYSILSDSIQKLEKELASSEMPKQPEVKTTGTSSLYR